MVFCSNDFFGCNILSVNPLRHALLSDQECKARPEVINDNSNEPLFYPSSIKIRKYSGSH